MVRNQIRLDTNTNMYLEPKYTSVVFSLYKEGSFKIQLWEKRKSMFRKRKMLTCCQKIKIRICLFPSMMFAPKFWKIQIGTKTKSIFGNLYHFHVWKN